MISSAENLKRIKARIDHSEARANRQLRIRIGQAMFNEVKEYAGDLLNDVELVRDISELERTKNELISEMRREAKSEDSGSKGEAEEKLKEIKQTLVKAKHLKTSIRKKRKALIVLMGQTHELATEIRNALNIRHF